MMKLSEILKIVSDHFGVPENVVKSQKRTNFISLVRHAFFFFARLHTPYTYSEIAKFVNRSDHTTVINGIKRINDALNVDTMFLEDMNAINVKLCGEKITRRPIIDNKRERAKKNLQRQIDAEKIHLDNLIKKMERL